MTDEELEVVLACPNWHVSAIFVREALHGDLRVKGIASQGPFVKWLARVADFWFKPEARAWHLKVNMAMKPDKYCQIHNCTEEAVLDGMCATHLARCKP